MPPPKLVVKPTPISKPLLPLFDVVVALMKGIAPLSAILIVFRIWAYLTGRRQSILLSRTTLFRRIVNVWLVCEGLFYLYCKRIEIIAQKQPHEEKVVKLSKENRIALFHRCLETVSSPQEFVESWYRTDHTFDDLKRDNIREWLAWGLFHKHNFARDMDMSEREELDNLVDDFELKCSHHMKDASWKFPDGYNSSALLMKFSEEPVTHTHRPLVMYTAVHFLVQELIAPVQLAYMGFKRHQENSLFYQVRYGQSTKPPLVFIHGLGIGILPYVGFLQKFIELTEEPNSPMFGRTIICIELHCVSQRILPAELHRDDFVKDVKAIMIKHNFLEGGIIMGHSYGSFAASWLATQAPEFVHALGLLDPACLFLHYPNVLYSILYKPPTNAYERFMHYLIREELFFNAHARRHFFWYANVLFLEDVDTERTKTLVVLSEDDFIVPIRPALKYVQNFNRGVRLNGKAPKEQSGKVDLVFLDQCDHGGFLWMKDHEQSVVKGVERLCE